MQTSSPFDIAADMDTPVSAMKKLAAFEPVFLLESVENAGTSEGGGGGVGGGSGQGQRLGRYSFVGLGRAMTVRVDGAGLSVDGGAAVAMATTREGAMAQMRELLAKAPRLLPTIPGVPLDGGLVGLVGYDFVRRLESKVERGRLNENAVEGVGAKQSSGGFSFNLQPSTFPHEAQEPEVLLVAPRSMLVFDHLTRRVAFVHAGPEWERQSLRREVMAALRGPVPPAPVRVGHAPPEASMSREAFLEAVGQVKEHIAAGDVFQLVLSVRFGGACRTDAFEVYRALRLLNPSPYMYYFNFGETQLVGSSPEALVKVRRQGIDGQERLVGTLRPIAGTRPRGASVDDDLRHERELLADAKEAAEHVMLVDLARNDLGRVAAAGTISVSPYRAIERYSHVMHIVSGVSGVLREGCDALDAFGATFPAGTVVGAPKVRAMQIIDRLEPARRGFYAGTVGYFAASGEMDMAIAIRTLMFHNGQYAYQAGAGIVADSDPEAEYREVRHKVGSAEAALKLAEEGL